jgi:hypothetical protein
LDGDGAEVVGVDGFAGHEGLDFVDHELLVFCPRETEAHGAEKPRDAPFDELVIVGAESGQVVGKVGWWII